MAKTLHGVKIAFLAANGFNERDLTAVQRLMLQSGAKLCVISPENGLLNGWSGEGWGHHYTIDATLSTALGADYDMLFIASGQRSLEKLKLTAHSKRFMGSFMSAGKPVVACDDAVMALSGADLLAGRTVSAPADVSEAVEATGAILSGEATTFDANLMTGACDDPQAHAAFIAAAIDFFASCDTMAEAA